MNDCPSGVFSLLDDDPDQFLVGPHTITPVSASLKGKHTQELDTKLSLRSIKSMKEREAVIVRDLLYVLVGNEGIFIKYSADVDLDDVFKCLKGVSYRVNRDIDVNFKDTTKNLCFLGKYYTSLECFLAYFGKCYYGKVMGRLCEYIRNFLNEYQTAVSELNDSFHFDTNFSLITLYQKLHNSRPDSPIPSIFDCMQHFYNLIQLLVKETSKRLENTNLVNMKFENIINSLKSDMNLSLLDEIIIDSQNSKYVKGGVILNLVQTQLDNYKGDVRSHQFFYDIFEFISIDFLQMTNQWLQFGSIVDPFKEFCIFEATTGSESTVHDSYYWRNKYAIKIESLLKQFESKKTQKKLFLTGKYLSIIRECGCIHSIEDLPYTSITSFQNPSLELLINDAYNRSNMLIMKLLSSGYQLSKFLSLLNKYFLLSDGSLFDSFLNEANHELKRSYRSSNTFDILRSYITSYDDEAKTSDKIEQLVNNSLITKFEGRPLLEDILEIIKTHATDANEILNSSNLNSLADLLRANIESNNKKQTPIEDKSGKESQRCNKLAIARFSIDIDIPFPLNQVISDSQKLEYQILFRHLALLKFTEKRFEKSWRELGYQTFWTWNFKDPRVRTWIKRCRFIHTKMFDFLRIYSYYAQFDIIVSNWSIIEHQLKKMDSDDYHDLDLSFLKSQITEFLSSSMCELLLSNSNMVTCLYEIFTLVIVFHEYVMSMRKALLLMDESLLNFQKEKMNLSLDYYPVEKEKRLNKLIRVLDSYHHAFNEKLRELCAHLLYGSEVDSPKMSILYSQIQATFNFH